MKKQKHFLHRFTVRQDHRALVYRNGKLVEVLAEGKHRIWDPSRTFEIVHVDRRATQLQVADIRHVAQSGLLDNDSHRVELSEHERGILRIDGQINDILSPGLHLLWKAPHAIDVEVVDASDILLRHKAFEHLVRLPVANQFLSMWEIKEGYVGLLFINGSHKASLQPGPYASWNGLGKTRVFQVDLREKHLDVGGQDILTSDRVSLRLNVSATYRVSDALRSVQHSEDAEQALYKEIQLAIRAEIGGRSLDDLLAEKHQLGDVLLRNLQERASELGLDIQSIGLRDVILPGEMKEILNQVILARKQAEANVITRREEAAAMRSQLNTAKLIADNPTLMRLRELEVLERVAQSSKLNVVLGEKGLTETVARLL